MLAKVILLNVRMHQMNSVFGRGSNVNKLLILIDMGKIKDLLSVQCLQ